MTFSYETPPTADKDKVRFWSTDTVERPYSVTDEDIAFLLAETSDDVMLTAALVCDRIADYWSTSSSAVSGGKSVGPFSTTQRDGADLEDGWRRRAARLRMASPSGLPTIGSAPIFTGDAVPEFSVGMQDNGLQNYPDRRRGYVEPANGVW